MVAKGEIMELEIIEESKNKLVIAIKGESHTFCNALKAELWNDKNVKNVSYRIPHPLDNIPEFTIETKSSDPKKVLASASKKLGKNAEKFKTLAKKELK